MKRMNAQTRYEINKLKRKYFLLRTVEIVLLSLGLFLLEYAYVKMFTIKFQNDSIKLFISLLSGVASLFFLFFRYKLHRLSDKSFARFLNQNFVQLKQSADLLFIKEKELTSLQQLQQQKTVEQFNVLSSSIKLPHRILRSIIILMTCVFVYSICSLLLKENQNVDGKVFSPKENPSPISNDASSIFIKSVSILITPPAYTNAKPFTSNDANLRFPEGSVIHWQIQFSSQPKNATIFFSGKDSINTSQNFIVERKIDESGFYQLQWHDNKQTHQSDYFKLEVIKDEAPKIEIKNLQQFTKLKATEVHLIELNVALTDDYGLTDAIIVATVSKGSGEGIKFREEKLRFTSPQKLEGKNSSASRSLDLKKLGLDPGDELYFYTEAWDNKMPTHNHARTETFFIAIQDTAQEITSVDAGLGVDLLPEYFRSQRQIIIDTEKLLREKKRLSKIQFNNTSNDLAADEKILRLRYGAFLGEEDEEGIGHVDAHQEEDEKDVTKKFGHVHDKDNEHNLVEKEHHHDGKNDDKENPLKAFAHEHDNGEEATFFIQSTRAKLKAAVTTMWDAELYLRLNEPEKSLPYQYKALNLLKQISNDSRVYVHRTGFEPPPLKEDKRLSGDLSEVKTNTNQQNENREKDFPAIRQALIVIENLLAQKAKTISVDDEKNFNKAAQEVAIEALKTPLVYLKSLSLVKSLNEKKIEEDEMTNTLLEIRKSFWKILPQQTSSPVKRTTVSNKLNEEFIKAMSKIKSNVIAREERPKQSPTSKSNVLK